MESEKYWTGEKPVSIARGEHAEHVLKFFPLLRPWFYRDSEMERAKDLRDEILFSNSEFNPSASKNNFTQKT